MRSFVHLMVLGVGLCLAMCLAPSASPQQVTRANLPAFTPTVNAGTDVVCALHADAITGLTCNNQVSDATTATPFTSTVTIPAGTLSANSTRLALNFGYVSSGAAASMIISIKLGSVVIYTGASQGSNSVNTSVLYVCNIVAGAAASATTPISTACAAGSFTNATRNTLLNTTSKSIAVDTTTAQTLTVTVIFGAATAGNALWLYSISQ